MNDRSSRPDTFLSIAAVERDTGLSKDTLRVWERRYGFPNPARDRFGERSYSIEQVDRLRMIRRLLDAGHRPGKVIALPVEQLRAIAAGSDQASQAPAPARASENDGLLHFLDLVRRHQVEALRQALAQAVLRSGLERFVVDAVAPLNHLVGEAWARGEFEVFEEHLYTESVQIILRGAIGTIPEQTTGPRVLLTTLPQEMHGIGLLMAEAMLALEGCRCVSLGVQTPIPDIVRAAAAQQADVVALSFSTCMNPNQVTSGLAELRAMLPAAVQLWAGGHSPVLRRKPPAGVKVLADLADIHTALLAWRAAP